jgi:ribosome-associated translation inhibitor RaiA
MKIAFSNLQEEFRNEFDHLAQHHIEKLEKLLVHYQADLVQLHGLFEKHSGKAGFLFSLTLTLPTGTIHTNSQGSQAVLCARSAFGDLQNQVKRHQALLRKDYEWKRKRTHHAPSLKQVPAAD